MIELGIIVFLLCLIVGILAYLMYIKAASKLKQTEREDGPSIHKVKNGTITMGGVVFILVPCLIYLIVNYLFKNKIDNLVYIVMLAYLSLGGIGFIDDFLKIRRKNNLGLSASMKLFLQVVVSTVIFLIYLMNNYETHIHLFGFNLDLKWIYGLLIFFYLVGYSNAVNITDGVDGLSGGLTLIILACFFIIALKKDSLDMAVFILALIATLVSYLLFNWPHAYLFMGDTGSLALGGLIAMLSIALHEEVLFLIFSGAFIFETISVMIQVIYFKLTKKRFFKMAPFHHHLELCGLSEKKVLAIFYTIGILLGVIGLFMGGFFK